MEDDQDNYDEEDTLQMLEKYAEEDDEEEDQCEEYYGTEGVNYAFLYDSPYDSTKDKDYFVDRLVTFYFNLEITIPGSGQFTHEYAQQY